MESSAENMYVDRREFIRISDWLKRPGLELSLSRKTMNK